MSSDAPLAPRANGAQDLATPAEAAAFQVAFLRLLERRAGLYTMGDSTSLPTHVAADLLRSVCFVLGIDPDAPEIPRELVGVDLEAAFRRRLDAVAAKVEATAELWRQVDLTMPPIHNISLRDTLESIGAFPGQYDYRSMAHEIPVDIDYQLCHPVPNELLGVDYVHEYLSRLLIEADFLARFDTGACVRVLKASCSDYLGLLINLYEPVAANAVGLALIGKDPHGLAIGERDRSEIVRRLVPLNRPGRIATLREAATAASGLLGITDPRAIEYLQDLAEELLPRIEVALGHGDLRGVFVS